MGVGNQEIVRKVAIATASRAERALLQPIYDKLGEMPEVQRWWFQVQPGEDTVYRTKEIHKALKKRPPEAFLVPADRAEMVAVAMVAYYMRIPVFHLWAGVGYTGTYDDLNRRVMSSFAYMHLVEDERAKRRLIHSGEQAWRIKTVGSTHADSLVVDEKMAPIEPFDLVLVNGNPIDPQEEMVALNRTLELVSPGKPTLWVEPSAPYRPGVMAWIRLRLPSGHRIQFMPTLARPLFLGLMSKCDRFITNSSSAVYEAPLLGAGRKVVNVGKRNAERTTESTKLPPAAATVADLLAHYTLDPTKLLKPYGRTPAPRTS